MNVRETTLHSMFPSTPVISSSKYRWLGISILHKVPGLVQVNYFPFYYSVPSSSSSSSSSTTKPYHILTTTTTPTNQENPPPPQKKKRKPKKTMAKPIHPATVHFPISFLFLSFTLDILHSTRASLPTSLQNSLLGPHDLTSAAHSLLSLGLLTAIPAVVTGGRELITMIQKQGMYESDGVTVKTKVKATIAHAVAMDVLLAVSSWIWYSRRQVSEGGMDLEKSRNSDDAAVYTHSTSFIVAEFLTLGLLLLGANTGGTLTYNYGVGFSSLSKAGKKDGKTKSL